MKKFSLSYVQGRLSKKVGDKFQYFPIDNWQNEFNLAKKIGFRNIEWIVSDLSNPILNSYSSLEIKKILKKSKINISSLSLDLIMDKPLHLWSKTNLEWLIKILNTASKTHSIKRINVPCEEQSRFFNHENLLKFKKNLRLILKILDNKTFVSLESDFSPKNIDHLLKSIRSKNLGINLDLGNIEANGYEIKNFFNLLSDKIFGIHIKERKILFGSTKKLSVNKNIKFLFSNIDKLTNLRDLTLQTYRSKNNFVKELNNNYKLINKLIKNYA